MNTSRLLLWQWPSEVTWRSHFCWLFSLSDLFYFGASCVWVDSTTRGNICTGCYRQRRGAEATRRAVCTTLDARLSWQHCGLPLWYAAFFPGLLTHTHSLGNGLLCRLIYHLHSVSDTLVSSTLLRDTSTHWRVKLWLSHEVAKLRNPGQLHIRPVWRYGHISQGKKPPASGSGMWWHMARRMTSPFLNTVHQYCN